MTTTTPQPNTVTSLPPGRFVAPTRATVVIESFLERNGTRLVATLDGDSPPYRLVSSLPSTSLADRQRWTVETQNLTVDTNRIGQCMRFVINRGGQRWAVEHPRRNESGQELVMAKDNESESSQRWQVLAQRGNGGRVIGTGSLGGVYARCWDVKHNNTKDGTPIQWFDVNGTGTANQMWFLRLDRWLTPEFQSSVVVRDLVAAAAVDASLRHKLMANPAVVCVEAGYCCLEPREYEAFNRYFKAHAPLGTGAPGDLEVGSSITCWSCQIGMFGIAAMIVAVGAAALAVVAPEAPIVIAAAGTLGMTPLVASGLLHALASVAVFTVDAVVMNLCSWTGVCG